MLDALDLLDRNLDELSDAPAFGVFRPGAHRVSIRWESKLINTKPSVVLHMKLLETIELANPADTPDAPGAEANVSFILRTNDGKVNEISEGKLKEITTALAPLVPQAGSNVKAIIQATEGAECCVVTKLRVNKNNGAENMDILELVL